MNACTSSVGSALLLWHRVNQHLGDDDGGRAEVYKSQIAQGIIHGDVELRAGTWSSPGSPEQWQYRWAETERKGEPDSWGHLWALQSPNTVTWVQLLSATGLVHAFYMKQDRDILAVLSAASRYPPALKPSLQQAIELRSKGRFQAWTD